MINTFIFRGEWLDNIKSLPLDIQDKVIAEIVRYGTKHEMEHEKDPMVLSLVNMVKGSIDNSIDNYQKKVDMSKTAGRKKKIDDKLIWELAQQSMTAEEIALELGCSKSSIDKSEGWKNRKNNL